ncbi:hypothetical protein CWO84_02880 [Methylomonas sp. Kb3]|uniref:hypothetical protein n=1 Tax=Methylomonas sp. Kb3 TaxID=1611544 RepID=UPI000C343D58|nr:hypothetical protein [Methylomonas sp. Kb3]PKD41986.1 hypothetical protein CWO84_02880 [Methylomonas sp. Kb3]
MALQPNTIENQLIDEICQYIIKDVAPSEFEIAGLKKKAVALKNVNHASYANILGMIACLDNDIEECQKQHELAIRLDGSVQHYESYCTSLYNLCCLKDALHWAETGLSLFPHAPKLITDAVNSSYYLGLFDKVLEHYQTLLPLQLPQFEEQVNDLVSNAEIVLNFGIHTDTLHKLSDILESVRIKYGPGIRTVSLSLLDTEENRELFQWIETSSDVETTVEMNFELCEILASRADLDLKDMTVVFRAYQK